MIECGPEMQVHSQCKQSTYLNPSQTTWKLESRGSPALGPSLRVNKYNSLHEYNPGNDGQVENLMNYILSSSQFEFKLF